MGERPHILSGVCLLPIILSRSGNVSTRACGHGKWEWSNGDCLTAETCCTVGVVSSEMLQVRLRRAPGLSVLSLVVRFEAGRDGGGTRNGGCQAWRLR